MADFTVIIPVYKTEATLDRCVRSVLDLPDAEILLIDDGSPDGCPGLCDGWAEKDRRYTNAKYGNATSDCHSDFS